MLAARTEAPREAAVLGLPPAEARPGAWRPAQEPGYSRCTSLSAEKVEEQLVTRAQGTPAAITASANRVPPGARLYHFICCIYVQVIRFCCILNSIWCCHLFIFNRCSHRYLVILIMIFLMTMMNIFLCP